MPEEPKYSDYYPGVQSPISNPSAFIENSQTQHLIEVLTEHETVLDAIKMQLRGEVFFEDPNTKDRYFKQIDKPAFVVLDHLNQPIRIKNMKTGQLEYVPNDEAIGEVISSLKFVGLNSIAPMTSVDEKEIIDDLREIESKIAVLLCVKRKKWGVDKALYPMYVSKWKTLVKDARFRSKDGRVLAAMRTITSRIENTNDAKSKPSFGEKVKSLYS